MKTKYSSVKIALGHSSKAASFSKEYAGDTSMARRTTTRNVPKLKVPLLSEVLGLESNPHAIPISEQLAKELDIENAQVTFSATVGDFDIEGLTREEVKAYNVIAEPGQRLEDTATTGELGKMTQQILSQNTAITSALPFAVHAGSEHTSEPVVLPCIEDASDSKQHSQARTKLTISPKKSPHFASSGRSTNMQKKRKASARPSQVQEHEKKFQEPSRSSKRKKYDKEVLDRNGSALHSVPEASEQTPLPNKGESSSSADLSNISLDSKAARRAAKKDRRTGERKKYAVTGAKSQETHSIGRSSRPLTETEGHPQSRQTRSSIEINFNKDPNSNGDMHLEGSSQQPEKAMTDPVMPGKKLRNKRLTRSSAEQKNQLTAFQKPMIRSTVGFPTSAPSQPSDQGDLNPPGKTKPKRTRSHSVTAPPYIISYPTKRSTSTSCIPFPPLSSTHFGLVQETLAHSPFRLLLACIFLNKTRGSVALPVFYDLMTRYPTPSALSAASHDDVVGIIQHLGLQNQRANTCINLAKAWSGREPRKGKRWRVLHYPCKGDGKDLNPNEIIDDEDSRIGWEVGQLPGVGVYAIDSWRIFCRDELRGLPNGLPDSVTGESRKEEMQKEWTRVLPLDKELRAYLRWRWLRNGFVWNPVTDERRPASEEEMEIASKGGVVYEGQDTGIVIAEKAE